MKKRWFIVGIVAIVLVVIVGGVFFDKSLQNFNYDFMGAEWESNGEVISFGDDGTFAYYEYSGNAVDNYDLCDEYSYDDKTGKINLICSNVFMSLFSRVKVIDYDEKLLTLSINGKKKIFAKLVDYDYEFVNFWVGEDDSKEVYLRFWSDGTIEYSEKLVVLANDFDKNYEYYNSECGEFSKEDNDTYEVKCPIDSSMGNHYIYDEDSGVITIFGIENEKEVTLKIIESNDEKLIVDFNNKIMEFKVD